MTTEVKPRGALETLDRAIELARSQSALSLLRACLPGALLAWLVLALYYVERVEGVRSLRPFFAVALITGFAIRTVVLGRWAGHLAKAELAQADLHAELASRALMVRASLWVAFELWFWLWPVVVLIHVDPWLVPTLVPVWCVRAAIAPSWLPVINVSEEATGFRAVRAAILHCEGQRLQAVTCELLLLLGALALIINLGAAMVALVTLAQTVMGLDLSSVRAFVSPQNHFMLLCVTSLALVLLEPVRASLASVLYVDAELVRGGAGVRALVTRALQPRQRSLGARAGLLLVLASLTPHGAQAQTPATEPPQHSGTAEVEDDLETDPSEEEIAEEVCDESCAHSRQRDATVEARVERILDERAFAEFPDETWAIDGKGALRRWLDKLFHRWSDHSEDPAAKLPTESSGKLPGTSFFLTLAVLLLMIALARLAFGGGPRRLTRAPKLPEEKEDPFARAADDHFADALRMFANSPRDALRALYLGALVGLSRKDLLQLAPERSNGHYLRQLQGRTQRAPFAELTRTFDAVQYGQRELDRDGFQHCLTLARDLVKPDTHATGKTA